MSYNTQILNHFTEIQRWAVSRGVSASLDLVTFRLELRGHQQYYTLVPQFLVQKDGRFGYVSNITTDTVGFIGWLPYTNKRWPVAIDKLLFKRFCGEQELAIPAWWLGAPPSGVEIIRKKIAGSFGEGLSAPMLTSANTEKLSDGEFFEQFVEGTMTKVWFWNQQPVEFELSEFPSIEGDGRSTIKKLLSTTKVPERDWQLIQAMCARQGVQLDSILPKGSACKVDFRYGRQYGRRSQPVGDIDTKYPFLKAAIGKAGAALWSSIPPDRRNGTLFSLDGIVTGDQVFWLEMNSNPMFPVKAYPVVLDWIFSLRPVKKSDAAAPAHRVSAASQMPEAKQLQ